MVPILWLFLLTGAFQAPAPASIRGTDIRPDVPVFLPGRNLSGAVVRLKPGNLSVVTRGGAFTLPNVPPGRYTISVTREGYVPAEDPRRGLTAAGLAVTLTAGQRLNDIEFPM